MQKHRRLEDAYRFIGFRPEPRVRGIFGDPKARIVRLLVERVEVGPMGADIKLRVAGLTSLVRDLQGGPLDEAA